jgi:hypothetical protein
LADVFRIFLKKLIRFLGIIGELSLSTFFENCHDSADFRLSVKRRGPKILQDAITAAIQEECLRQTEREKHRVD